MRLPRPSRRTTRAQARVLSTYWDEVARRAPAEPVPPAELDRDLATTVRHLAALPGGAPPDPRFAAQLLDRLASSSQERTTMPTASPRPLGRHTAPATDRWTSVPTTDRWTSPADRPFGLPTPAKRRWSAVAITAVAALVVAAIWVTSLRGGDPQGRRDTTAVAAMGATEVPASTPAVATPASSSVNLSVTADGGNTLFFTGVVPFSGPYGSAELWLIDVAPGGTLSPAAADSHLVMPLSGTLGDASSPLVLSGGQAMTFLGTSPWRLTNPTDAIVPTLVLSLGADQPPGANAIADPLPGADAPPTRAVNLGPLYVDPSLGVALLEVTTLVAAGSTTWFDTGRDGQAVILAETSPTVVDIVAGTAGLIRARADGSRDVGIALAGTGGDPNSAFLAAGDILSIADGAAASVRGGADSLPVLVVTLRFDSARLQSIQRGVISIPATTNAAGTPVAPNGCDIGRWTEDELRQRLATPSVGPLPSLGLGLADGVPADDETVADIDAAADRLASCVQTNDPLRYSRLWSGDGLRFFYSVRDLDEDLAMEALPDESVGMVDATVQDVRVHPDRRVSAVVDLDGEIAYVVWVREDGVWLVELFNDAIFSGALADGARCDTVPLDATLVAAIVPESLVPATPPSGDRGLDISAPLPEGTTPGPVPPGQLGADIATEAVTRIFDCLSTLDPTRIVPLATDAFRGQWLGVAGETVPLGEPATGAETRLPLSIPTITSVETWSADGTDHVGAIILGESTAAYMVLTEVDGQWLINGWAPL